MFESLSTRLQDVFKSLRGETRLTPDAIEAALREIRLALLEAEACWRQHAEEVQQGGASGGRVELPACPVSQCHAGDGGGAECRSLSRPGDPRLHAGRPMTGTGASAAEPVTRT